MRQYKLIIFDWDGTLIDSIGRIVSSMQSAARDSGLAIPSEPETKAIIGLSLPEAVEALYPGRTTEQEVRLIAQYRKYYIDLDPTPTPMFAYARELLSGLRADNRMLAVATGKGRSGLERVWQDTQTKDYFHSSRCGDEHVSKPAPDMLNSLLDEMAVTPQESIMIGDSSLDLAMANNAGIDSIGVSHGVHDAQTLARHSPKAIVDSLEDLYRLIVR